MDLTKLTIKARAEINRNLADGEKVPEGKQVVSFVPLHVADPSRPNQAWPAVKLNTRAHGGRIEFIVDESTLDRDPLLSDIKNGETYQIVISDSNQ